jgi:iron complex outermembrane recepter protein
VPYSYSKNNGWAGLKIGDIAMKYFTETLNITVGLSLICAVSVFPNVGNSAQLEEVIVTARKRAENLQQTPIAVTALTGESLAQANISELTAIERQTPNLSFTVGQGGGGSTVNAFIRGVGEGDFIITTDPAVGLYLDGVYLARTFGANMELDDIERIEVLRGPQGTLFGKNSIGGAISVVTRKPTGENTAQIGFTTGSNNHQGLSAYGQTALTDTLAASLSYLQKNADGWQERPGQDAGDINVKTARLILNWAASEQIESTLSLDWVDQDQSGYPNVMLAFNDVAIFSNLWNTLNPTQPCCTPNTDIDRAASGGPLPNDRLNGWGVNWTNSWQLDALQLKSITSYREMDALFGRDGDNALFAYVGDVHDQNHEQLSQEFQITGGFQHLDWVLGAYYFEEESRDDTDLIIIQGIGTSVSYHNVQNSNSYALYGHLTYALTDKLELLAGLRYTQEEKDFVQSVSSFDFSTPYVFPIPGVPVSSCDFTVAAAYFDCSQNWSETSPKLGLMYQLSEDVMFYTHVSRGFRSGGYNGRAFGSAGDLQEYNPETLTSYELGFKSELLDRSLRLNGSLFYNDYQDIQILVVQAASVAIENASNATISGLELEATWLLNSQWQVQAGLGLTQDDSDGWIDVTGDHTDTELKQTPDRTFNLASDYTLDLGERGTLLLRADLKYKSEFYIDGVNTDRLHPGGHTFFNASILYRTQSEAWEIALHGENLSDKRVLSSGFDGTAFFGFIEGSYNPPRRYYANLKYRF